MDISDYEGKPKLFKVIAYSLNPRKNQTNGEIFLNFLREIKTKIFEFDVLLMSLRYRL